MWQITIRSGECPYKRATYHVAYDNGQEYKVLKCGAYECAPDNCPRRCMTEEWQPIETAPKDGSWILLGYFLGSGGGGHPMVAMWHSLHEKWCDGKSTYNDKGYFSPTHWMPLPKDPDGWDKLTGRDNG